MPGVTAAQAAAAAAGLCLTQRGLATGLRYVTGHRCADGPLDLDWAGLADPATTLVVYMGSANIGEIAARLMSHGVAGEMPVLAIASAHPAGRAAAWSRGSTPSRGMPPRPGWPRRSSSSSAGWSRPAGPGPSAWMDPRSRPGCRLHA